VVTVNHALVGSISVLPGLGDGTFAPRTDYTTGARPNGLAVGDLDGDGRLDVVTVGRFLSVRLGLPGGTLGPSTDTSIATELAIALARVNSDIHLDLLSAASVPGLKVRLGDGAGDFGPASGYGPNFAPISVATGDLDQDGDIDVALGGQFGNSVHVLLGGGDGTFENVGVLHAGVNTRGVAIADVDADGKPDVLTANPGSHTMSFFPGHGDGTFGEKEDYGTGASPSGIAVADFDEDGYLDAAVSNAGNGTVSILRKLSGSTLDVPIAPRASSTLRLSPNPTYGPLSVAFTLPHAARVAISVVDLQGRRIARFGEGDYGAGPHRIDGDVTRRAPIAPGLYFVRVEGAGAAAAPFVILR